MNATVTPQLLTPEEVAARLGVHKVTLLRYVTAGRLPVIRLSPTALRFRPEDVEALIERSEVANGQTTSDPPFTAKSKASRSNRRDELTTP